MGESENNSLNFHFDGHLRVEFKGAKVISHSRRTVFQMAEMAVPEKLFSELLERICCLLAVPTKS